MRVSRFAWFLAVICCSGVVAAAPIVLEGEVPEEGDFFSVPFEVPAGTAEIVVHHEDGSSANILDWGLEDPAGTFRGWGGGNPEPALVSADAASRSYLPGAITPGTWRVVVGKAQIKERPARYRIEVELRTTSTLPAQPQRSVYAHAPALKEGRRWYAGDLHVHSLESGDARPTLDAIATFAQARGLDFVAVSDHNTRSHVDFIPDAQARNPDVLLVPSVEFTTYAGHANAFGATAYVDHRIGFNGMTLQKAIDDFSEQGAVFTINHPTLDIGSGCIGCAWEHPIPRRGVGAVEVGVGGWDTTGALFDEAAIAFWDRLSDRGLHLAPVGGSDDHRAGVNLNQTQSPIGDPTTLILADALSVPALIDGLRAGRTVVKLRGPDDPMVTLDGTGDRKLDTLVGPSTTLRLEVTGGKGHTVRWVQDGVPSPALSVTSDPFVLERQVQTPEDRATRFRAEVLVGGRPRTITGHVWLSRTWPPPEASSPLPRASVPHSCATAVGGGSVTAVLVMALLWGRRRSLRARQ